MCRSDDMTPGGFLQGDDRWEWLRVDTNMPTDRWLLSLGNEYMGVYYANLSVFECLKFSIIKTRKYHKYAKIKTWENNEEYNLKIYVFNIYLYM